jgi:hypothetical protein
VASERLVTLLHHATDAQLRECPLVAEEAYTAIDLAGFEPVLASNGRVQPIHDKGIGTDLQPIRDAIGDEEAIASSVIAIHIKKEQAGLRVKFPLGGGPRCRIEEHSRRPLDCK